MGNKYYKPGIEEFVQGFNYQLRIRRKGDKIGSTVLWNVTTEPIAASAVYCKEDYWHDSEVNWKYQDDETIVQDHGEYNFISSGKSMNMWNKVSDEEIEKLLSNGDIRARK